MTPALAREPEPGSVEQELVPAPELVLGSVLAQELGPELVPEPVQALA